MGKIFLLSIGIMLGIIAILGMVFITSSPNNDTIEHEGYQINIITSGSWQLEIISKNNKILEKYKGEGNSLINLENINCIPDYNIGKIENNNDNVTIQILLNGKIIEEKELSKNETFLEINHNKSSNNLSENNTHIKKYKNRK